MMDSRMRLGLLGHKHSTDRRPFKYTKSIVIFTLMLSKRRNGLAHFNKTIKTMILAMPAIDVFCSP